MGAHYCNLAVAVAAAEIDRAGLAALVPCIAAADAYADGAWVR